MEFALTPEQEMLRETARRFLEDKASMTVVRDLMETESGFDPALWSDIAAQGWQAMAIPEEYGGAGFTHLELCILMEEMGRSLFPSPYLSSIVLGSDLVLTAGTDEQKAELLPPVAAGESRLALAQLEPGGGWTEGDIEMVATADGDDLVLDGAKSFVLDGHTADRLIVAVRGPGAGISLLIVDADAPGLSRHRVETLDMTRKQAEITFRGVRVPSSRVLGEPGSGWAHLEDTMRRAVIALAYEQVGGAQVCMDMSVEYAKERVQFGRPIGSFQAIKHACADMLVRVEAARSTAYHAGRAAIGGDPGEVAIAAALAKSYCSETYFHCAGENIQIHGGIGFTWEHDAHLYFKRAKTDELLFGAPAHHRGLLAAGLGI